MAVKRPEEGGSGVVGPPTQAVVKVTGAVRRRRGGDYKDQGETTKIRRS